MVATTEAFKKKQFQVLSPTGQDYRPFIWGAALSLLMLQFLPYLLLSGEAYIRIHDTLEGIDYQNLFRSGKTFDYAPGAVIEQVMNGLPRPAVKTGWSFVGLWLWLFGLYDGYILNYIVVHLAAFFGMYLLLRQHVLRQPRHEIVRLGTALCFSYVPMFTMLGMTSAGQPLVAWAFLNLLRNNRNPIASWLVLTLFPFYSDIVWAGLPVLVLAGIYWLHQFWKTGRWNRPYLAALVWMTALYLAVNWQLFQITFFTPGFVSHRAEYDYFYNKNLTIWHSLKETLQVFFVSHHHVGIFISLPVLLAAWMAWRFSGWSLAMLTVFRTILIISLFYGFYNWLVFLGDGHFVLLKSFKFERVIVLLPTLWLVLFALSLGRLDIGKPRNWGIGMRRPFPGLLISQLLIAQFLLCFLSNDELAHNLRQLAGHPHKPNFEAFFDEKLFSEIGRYIALPKENYRVVSLGMHPSVAQYNGFYTLDCHASLYDLRYKRQFRKMMAGELAKDPVIRNEFDHFGNRCYLYSSELGKEFDAFLCGKTALRKVQHLELDTKALCWMGGCYLLSAVEIGNATETGLRLEKVFEGKFWRVHLYEVSEWDFADRLSNN